MSLSPRLITVSCFGTLVKRKCPRGVQYRDALQKYFPPGTAIPSALALAQGYKNAFNKHSLVAPNFGSGTVSSRIWWHGVMRDTVIDAGGHDLASGSSFDTACEDLYDNLHEQWDMYSTTVPALSNLRSWCDKNDCSLGVVANMDDRLPQFLNTFGIADNFDFILSSYDCGVEQPHPHIYYNAVMLASVPPSAFAAATTTPPALHCGNCATGDLHGALGAGFASMLVNTKFDALSPLKQMITEWQGAANAATRAWHSPHLGLAMSLLRH